MAVTTTATVDPEILIHFDNILLDRRKPQFIHMVGAQQRSIPKKDSKTATFRRYDPLTDALTPIDEGISPSSEQITKFDFTITTNLYGKVVELSDEVIITVQDRTSNETADMLTQNMNSTLDKIVRNMLNATSATIASVNGVNGGTPTELNQTDIDLAIDFLEGNNCVKFVPNIPGGPGLGTAPRWSSYWGLVHSDLRSDLKAVDSFLSVNQYPNPKLALQAELGATDEISWLMSSEVYESAGTYNNIIFGQNAYARVEINDLSSEFIIKPIGWGNDPLNQRSTFAWKSRFAAGILDDGWVVNQTATKA